MLLAEDRVRPLLLRLKVVVGNRGRARVAAKGRRTVRRRKGVPSVRVLSPDTPGVCFAPLKGNVAFAANPWTHMLMGVFAVRRKLLIRQVKGVVLTPLPRLRLRPRPPLSSVSLGAREVKASLRGYSVKNLFPKCVIANCVGAPLGMRTQKPRTCSLGHSQEVPTLMVPSPLQPLTLLLCLLRMEDLKGYIICMMLSAKLDVVGSSRTFQLLTS